MLKEGMIVAERYEIISKIGAGGMADVYKAKDHKLNRFVAVKVMKSEFREDSTFITKFTREAQAAAGLANPNIVNVFDVGEDNGVYFIVMELVEGITLKEYIAKKGKLSVREATSIAIQVCMGLEAAHAQNIVHRDVKPQNIIISTDGKVKVTDFGIARAASSNTISSNAMGSVHYSSPEQVRGGYADSKSDIYSVGITIYEMVTGRVPFDGDTTVAIAIKHLQDEMEAPSRYTPELPHSLEQIIYKCTQKSPDRRYSSMSGVISDLKHSLIDPNGDFVTLMPLTNHARTVVLSNDEMAAIKAGRQTPRMEEPVQTTFSSTASAKKGYEDLDDDDYDDYDDDYDDEGGISSKLEKAMTIGGFIIGALIICLLIYVIAQAAGIFKFGSKTDQDASPTPTETPTVTVGEDEETVDVPTIVGKTPENAQAEANKYGLGIEKVGEAPSEFPAGTICAQDPKAGTSVDKHTTIGYTLSTGSSELSIPDVVNRTASEAQQMLTDAGITLVSLKESVSDSVAIGNVISVEPQVGSVVTATDTVTLTISTGPSTKTVSVPEVRGYPEDQAREIMENAGLVVKTDKGHSDRVALGEVMAQSIAGGSEVSEGTEITLTINSEEEEEPTPTPTPENTPTTDTGAATTSSWVCNERVGAPSNYTGGAVRLVLEQTVNGEKAETVILEQDSISFPYELDITGASGVTSGKVLMYELVNGNYKLRCNWPVTFSEQ